MIGVEFESSAIADAVQLVCFRRGELVCVPVIRPSASRLRW